MATLEETLRSLGLSAARGIPQLATGFVDLAALPFTATGMLKPEQAVGSTAYLTSKGLLPPEQQGLLNQTTELVSSAMNPAVAAKAALAKGGLLATAPIAFAGTTIGKPLNNPLNTLDRMSPWFIKYPKAADTVDGLKVGESVKNQSSIPASFSKYEIEKGIKSIPISDFKSSPTDLFRSADDLKRVSELAKQIKQNKYIDPLIVAVDEKGPYILEGGHRLGALNLLGIKNFPAMVVRDLDY